MDPITNSAPNNINDAPQVVGAPQLDPSLVIPTVPNEPVASEAMSTQTAPVEPGMATMSIPTAPLNPDEPVVPAASTTMAAGGVEMSASPQPMAADMTVPVMGDMPLNDGPMGGGIVNPASMATPGFAGGIGATDPITMPTPPKAPDPVEEELKAPLKAAEPVPGSIGSAISMPAQGAAVNRPVDTSMFQKPNATNVALGGKATQQAPMQGATQVQGKPAKKKTSKTTYILLGVVGAMVVIALIAVLVTQLTS